MIVNLKIKNYALIESLDIDFIPGFITITGETGAGKSILMGALSLILGQRADSTVLLNKEKKCFVEGEFVIPDRYAAFFEENELDYEAHSLLRREILPSGKSRAFINDTPVTLNVLKELGDQLVDVHSQHQSLKLKDHLYQLEVVDIVAGNLERLSAYQKKYTDFILKQKELAFLEEEISKIQDELDFFQYQYDELMGAKLDDLHLIALEDEVRQLEHAEEIKTALGQTADLLNGEMQILSMLSETLSLQKKIKALNKPSEEYYRRLESAYIDLKDLSVEVEGRAETMEGDPEKLQKLKDRIDLVYVLLQKHKVKEKADLIVIRDDLGKKIEKITFSEESVGKLKKELESLRKDLLKAADELHENRSKIALFINEQIENQLHSLGMPNATFVAKVDRIEAFDRMGISDVRFLFSANKQLSMEEISKVASGGEISRVMLSIKSLLSDYKGLATLIFDEIDTGVSGEIADKMGCIMRKMAGGRQVIAITHLPQVASQGSEHFMVYKIDEGEQTHTHLRKLSREERITELAKLLSGEQLSEAALSNAKELLNNKRD